jgi:hypothetical protein
MVAMAVIAQFVRQKNLVQRKDDLQTQSNTSTNSTTVSTTNSNSSSNVTTSNGNGQ